jgi:von Willebrand factor type A domain
LDIRFLTPLGALFALTALVPLAVFFARQRRASRIGSALGLAEPSRVSRAPLALALAAVPGLIGLAAAQPIVEESRSRPERVDAEAFVVLDITRSMLASVDPEAPRRLDRAREFAARLRDDFPEVPIGVASMTDRLLPHAFPTTDRRVFVATIQDAVDIERPGAGIGGTLATSLGALSSVPELNYFAPTARRRLLVVLTDGETLPVRQSLAAAFQRRPRVETIFVHFWDPAERIYEVGVAEGGYRPQQGAEAALSRVASLVEGRVFSEDDADRVSAAARGILGEGEMRERRLEGERLALMPYVTLAAILPLGFLLLRRNL